jgi:hypothetical protein
VMLLVDGSERARRVVAADADVLFSDRGRNGAFGLLPRVGVDDAAALRSHADAAWA